METYVCENNPKKVGGYGCGAKYRVKWSKAVNDVDRVIVELNSIGHNHDLDENAEERVYLSYSKQTDRVIEQAILDGLAFQQVRKKVYQTFPNAEAEFSGTKGVRKLYSKFHRYVTISRLFFPKCLPFCFFTISRIILLFTRVKAKCGKSRKHVDISELEDFIAVHSLEPEEDRTPYIVGHCIELLEEDDGDGGPKYFVNMLISSKALMKMILFDESDKVLSIDTTHGLSIDRLLLCLAGSININHEFSPLVAALTTNENTKSCGQVLKWIKDNDTGVVRAVMADGSNAITKAIRKVFGDTALRLMCYAHFMR